MATLSQHPVDALIRDVIGGMRTPVPNDGPTILAHIATAPFDPRPDVIVPTKDRGLVYEGRVIGARASALTLHLAKRIVGDAEWSVTTSPDEYVADLKAAVRRPDVRLGLYKRRGGYIVAAISPNGVPSERLGPRAKPWLLVVYSADRGTIITGYQVAAVPPTGIPEDALWLT